MGGDHMIVVLKRKGDSKDNLFRKFKKMFNEEDIIFDVNKKIFFKNPTLLKKEKIREKQKRKAQKKAYGKGYFRSEV